MEGQKRSLDVMTLVDLASPSSATKASKNAKQTKGGKSGKPVKEEATNPWQLASEIDYFAN